MNNKTVIVLVTGLLLAITTSGCATIRGSQDSPSVMNPASSSERIGSVERVDIAIGNFHGTATSRGGKTPFAYRNVMITSYSALIEADYRRFKDQLYAGDRGTALGFDLLQLGFTGAISLAGANAVDELTTLTIMLAGARSSVDKRLFYDRTINALIASMDAERFEIKADIARKRKLPAIEYTLDDAVFDLDRLIEAGNINGAYLRLAKLAEEEKSRAEARLNDISEACADINVPDAALREEFRNFIRASNENMAAAAEAMGVEGAAGSELDAGLRHTFATEYCGNEKKRELLDRLKPADAGDG